MQYRKLSELKKLEKNPRIITKEGQKKLTESLENLGFLEGQPIIVSDRTGELIIVSGNQRYEIAKKLGMKEVPTELLRVIENGEQRMPTEQEEDEAIIRLNVNNGDWNFEMLADWNQSDIDDWGIKVLGDIDAKDEWTGMPEFKQDDLTPHRQIIISLASDEDVLAFSELIGQNITDKTKSLWFPKMENEKAYDKRYGVNGNDME